MFHNVSPIPKFCTWNLCQLALSNQPHYLGEMNRWTSLNIPKFDPTGPTMGLPWDLPMAITGDRRMWLLTTSPPSRPPVASAATSSDRSSKPRARSTRLSCWRPALGTMLQHLCSQYCSQYIYICIYIKYIRMYIYIYQFLKEMTWNDIISDNTRNEK